MKKVLALAVAFGLGFALMGCNTPTTPTDETTPVVEEVIPAAEVVEVVVPAEEIAVEDMDAMNGEMVMDEMMTEEVTPEADVMVEEIVETPAE